MIMQSKRYRLISPVHSPQALTYFLRIAIIAIVASMLFLMGAVEQGRTNHPTGPLEIPPQQHGENYE